MVICDVSPVSCGRDQGGRRALLLESCKESIDALGSAEDLVIFLSNRSLFAVSRHYSDFRESVYKHFLKSKKNGTIKIFKAPLNSDIYKFYEQEAIL